MIVLELYVFILAAFTGYMVISRVPPLLHTPLMAATNAISGISLVVGATMFRNSSRAAIATTGKMKTATFHGVVHGSHFSLMKISQTKNA